MHSRDRWVRSVTVALAALMRHVRREDWVRVLHTQHRLLQLGVEVRIRPRDWKDRHGA